MTAEPVRFVCPFCGRATSLPADVAARYCPCCGAPPELPRDCPHVDWREMVARLVGPAR